MTNTEIINKIISRKGSTYPVPKLPVANPDDYHVFQGPDELNAVLAEVRGMNERRYPVTQFQRVPDAPELQS